MVMYYLQIQTMKLPCPAETSPDPLGDLQSGLFRVLRSLVFRQNVGSALGELPFSQMRCLHAIAREEMQKMHALADKLEIKLPALSQIVDRLVKRGLVVRHADAGDRRAVRLGLTEAARAVLADARAERHARLAATVAHLDAEALPGIIEGLRLLAAAAERAEAAGKAEPSPLSPDADPLVEMMARRARSCRRGITTEPARSPGAETDVS